MPNAQVIDLTKQGFRGDARHPSNTTPDHYESSYYRAYMDQMNENVLHYMLQNPLYLKKRKRRVKK